MEKSYKEVLSDIKVIFDTLDNSKPITEQEVTEKSKNLDEKKLALYLKYVIIYNQCLYMYHNNFTSRFRIINHFGGFNPTMPNKIMEYVNNNCQNLLDDINEKKNAAFKSTEEIKKDIKDMAQTLAKYCAKMKEEEIVIFEKKYHATYKKLLSLIKSNYKSGNELFQSDVINKIIDTVEKFANEIIKIKESYKIAKKTISQFGIISKDSIKRNIMNDTKKSPFKILVDLGKALREGGEWPTYDGTNLLDLGKESYEEFLEEALSKRGTPLSLSPKFIIRIISDPYKYISTIKTKKAKDFLDKFESVIDKLNNYYTKADSYAHSYDEKSYNFITRKMELMDKVSKDRIQSLNLQINNTQDVDKFLDLVSNNQKELYEMADKFTGGSEYDLEILKAVAGIYSVEVSITYVNNALCNAKKLIKKFDKEPGKLDGLTSDLLVKWTDVAIAVLKVVGTAAAIASGLGVVVPLVKFAANAKEVFDKGKDIVDTVNVLVSGD